MNEKYFIVEEIWREIKTYLFHNIKIHGKHLKDDVYIKKYNNLLKKIPRKYSPKLGPRIVYTSRSKNDRFVKFLYKIPAPRFLKKNIPVYKLIIEITKNKNLSDKNMKIEYLQDVCNDDFAPKNFAPIFD